MNLLGDLGHELSGAGRTTVLRIPGDRLDPARIEAMDHPTHPRGRAITMPGDLGVGPLAPRQQNDAGVAVIHLIDESSFHTLELAPLMGPERPCFKRFDSSFSISILNISWRSYVHSAPKVGVLRQTFTLPR
jgi:hypothetical protein